MERIWGRGDMKCLDSRAAGMLHVSDKQPTALYHADFGRVILVVQVLAKRVVAALELTPVRFGEETCFGVRWPVREVIKVVITEYTEGTNHWMVMPVERTFMPPVEAQALAISNVMYQMAGGRCRCCRTLLIRYPREGIADDMVGPRRYAIFE